MTVLQLESDGHIICIKDESSMTYTDDSLQVLNTYQTHYRLGEENFMVTSAYSVHYGEPEAYACLLSATGGRSTVHAESGLLHNNHCLIAISAFLVCLQLPDLSLAWNTQVDSATCFGLYHLPNYASYVSHGELEITCVSYDGEIIWSAGGKDIFTNGFTLYENYAEVLDFNNEKYRIDLLTGHSQVVLT